MRDSDTGTPFTGSTMGVHTSDGSVGSGHVNGLGHITISP